MNFPYITYIIHTYIHNIHNIELCGIHFKGVEKKPPHIKYRAERSTLPAKMSNNPK